MSAVFAGKVALVTGAASGIGRATALAFAKAGASLVLGDLDAVDGTEVAAEAETLGVKAVFVRTDVSVAADCERLVEAARRNFGRLDCAFNNAGVSGGGPNRVPTGEYPLDRWQQVIDVNLSGVFYCLHYELPLLLESGGGTIVNTASTAGSTGMPNIVAYVASKHGVIGLTRAVCEEYAAKGIRCNAVAPGITETGMTGRFFAAPDGAVARDALAQIPAGRFGRPMDIAEAVLWLSSPASAYVNGHCLPVDGGYLVR